MADVLPASADILPSNDNHASDMPPEEEAAQGAQDMHSDHEAQDSQAESLAAPAAEVPDSTDMPDGAADHAEQAEADTDVANLAAPAAEVQEDLGSAPESATATAESASTVGDTANNGDSSIQKPASFKKQVRAHNLTILTQSMYLPLQRLYCSNANTLQYAVCNASQPNGYSRGQVNRVHCCTHCRGLLTNAGITHEVHHHNPRRPAA